MKPITYQTITTIKESEKSSVILASMDEQEVPVVVKRMQNANPEVYRILSQVDNVHIPRIYALEQQEDILVVAEEYVDGESLAEYLQKDMFSDEQKINYALQLCETVGFLHTLKPSLIHRDIKPSNILINGKGELKLIDFDASRQYKDVLRNSDTRLLGTVEYAPPEQFGYSQTDVRSDIYSMGVVFHEMRPTEDKKIAEQWEKIAEKCTSFDPKNRYQSVAELVKEIQKLKNRKLKRKRAALLSGAIAMTACVVATLALGMWQRQSRETEGDKLELTSFPSPTVTVSPIPTLSLTVTLSPTPTSSPTPTASPKPSVTATVTPVPTMTEKMRMLAGNLITPSEISASPYNYYKGEAENVDLIYTIDVIGVDITILGGMCYRYETKEYIYIPSEMLDGGTTYYRVADEFILGLEPGLYHFYIARETETGHIGYSGRSAEIHPDNVSAPKTGELLIETSGAFYSEYQRDVDFVVWCDVTSRISGVYRNSGASEWEQLNSSWYEIIMDGKVLLIKKEYLTQHLEEDTLTFTVVFDDGRSEEVEVQIVQGLHPKVSPTPGPTLTPTPSPSPTATPTPMPILTPSLIPTPTPTVTSFESIAEIQQQAAPYYKSMPGDIPQVFGHNMTDLSLLRAECYNYVTGETLEIPLDMMEIGAGYTSVAEEYLQTLQPSVYNFVFIIREEGISTTMERVIQIYPEEIPVEPEKWAGNYFWYEGRTLHSYEPWIQAIIRNEIACKITGVSLKRADGTELAVEPEGYDIACNGRTILVKRNFLMQYLEDGPVTLIYLFDDGSRQEVVVSCGEQATLTPTPSPSPTPSSTPMTELLPVPETINQHYYPGLVEETELILRHGWGSGQKPSEWHGTCYNYADGTTVMLSRDVIDIGAGYIRILDDFLLTLEPSVYELTLYFYSESGGFMGSTERTLQVHTESAMPGSSSRPFSRSKDSFYVNAPMDFMNDIGSYSTSRFTGVAVQMEGKDRETVEMEWYEILCDGKVLILKKEYLLQYAGVDKLTLTYFFDDGRQFELELLYEGNEDNE